MPHQTGQFDTPHAGKYLTQLCKHFGHKVPATQEGDQGQVRFDAGTARLEASAEALSVTLSTEDAGALPRLREVIDSHLARFAFREDFTTLNWQPARA